MRRSLSALFAASLFLARAQESRIDFASYFGGGEPDFGNTVAVGPGGDIWIAGVTHSTNFPVTAAHQSRCMLGSLQSCYDGFLARLSADGRTVRFSTYLGAATNDEITALAVDEQGYAYVTGRYRDGLLAARFDPQGRAVYVQSFGGPLLTIGRALAIDDRGNLYLAGETSSPSFPAVNAIHSGSGPVSCMAIGGGGIPIDAVVMKLDPSGRVLFSTYISGNGHDFASAIAVDALGRIYAAGGTTSTNLPLPNALQETYGGGPPQPVGTCAPGDAFVLQIDPVLGRVLFGTLLGGPGRDDIDSIFVGSGGIVTVTGTTGSGALVARIDPAAPSLLHSRGLEQPLGRTWMSAGGRLTGGTDRLVRLDPIDGALQDIGGFGAPIQRSVEAPDGTVLAIGSATGRDSFTPTAAFQPNNAGFHDVWFGKTTPARDGRVIVVNAASFSGPEIAPGSIATLFSPEPGEEVRFQNLPAQVIAAAGNQISILVPEDATPGAAEIAVLRGGQQVASGSALVALVAPAIFTAGANGRGAPAAQLVRVSRDSRDESILVLYGTGLRHRTSMDRVKAVIAGVELPVQYAGAQPEFAGLDQVNVSLPATLNGRGDVDLVLVVDGRLSNAVRLDIP